MLGRWLIAAVWPRAGSDAVSTSRGRPASLGHALDWRVRHRSSSRRGAGVHRSPGPGSPDSGM